MFTNFYGDCKAFVVFRFLQQYFVFFNPTIANVGLS